MTRIIPRELIKHLEWNPGQEESRIPNVNPDPQPAQQRAICIDDILKGETFYSNEQKDGKYIGVAVALQEALDFAGTDGYVVTMPELIAAKIKADKSHDFWNKWHTIHTEENIGIDKKGTHYRANEPVLVVINGGGILTPRRIMQAYNEGLINYSARYQNEEFDSLLDGQLPNGDTINLYNIEEIKRGISDLPHKFGVVMSYEDAQNTTSGYHKKKEFMENPLVIARAGGLENLEAYYEKAKDSDGDLGNYHPFEGRDASTPQGRVLFLYYNCLGLRGGNFLNVSGRFVGVAPEAQRAKKIGSGRK